MKDERTKLDKWKETTICEKNQTMSPNHRQKDCKRQMWWVTPKKQCIPDTARPVHIWTHRDHGKIHKTCTSSSHTRSQNLEKWTQDCTPTNKAICNCYPMAKEKSVSSNGILLGMSMTFQGRSHVQEYITQN